MPPPSSSGWACRCTDPERSVRSLSGGQRQLVAVARAVVHQPRLLLLDEPTASLGVQESALVEELIARVQAQGTTIVLACHDISQMFRLADRIAVLRHGRLVAEVAPSEVHPGDVVALVSGQEVDASARRQLTRLHGLTDRLVSADPSSSLSLILSALGAALGSERLCIHLLAESGLVCAASLGLAPSAAVRRGPSCRWARRAAPVGLAASRAMPDHRGRRARRGGLDRLRRAGQVGEGRQLLVGSGARPGRAPGRHHRVPRHRGQAAARRPRPGHALRRVRGQRYRAGPAAGRSHLPQPACWRRSGRCSRPWLARPRSPTGCASPSSCSAAGWRPTRWRCWSSRPTGRRAAGRPPPWPTLPRPGPVPG